MKIAKTSSLVAGFLLALLPAAQAQPQAGGGAGASPDPHGIRMGDRRPHEKEMVTFLGIETVPVSATLTAQLALPRGVGLVVTVVVPDSPAAGVLLPHDVLTKLNDQVLIDPRQLGVLIRNMKDGDEVALTLVRGGKEQTAKAKLGRHEVPRMDLGWVPGGPGPDFRYAFGEGEGRANPIPHFIPREQADRMLRMIRREDGPERRVIMEEKGNGTSHTSIVNLGRSNLVYTDDDGTLELKIDDGRKNLVAKGKDGKTVFSGPINTDEERKAVPPEILARLKNLETPDNLGDQIDGEFEEPMPPPAQGRPTSATLRAGAGRVANSGTL